MPASVQDLILAAQMKQRAKAGPLLSLLEGAMGGVQESFDPYRMALLKRQKDEEERLRKKEEETLKIAKETRDKLDKRKDLKKEVTIGPKGGTTIRYSPKEQIEDDDVKLSFEEKERVKTNIRLAEKDIDDYMKAVQITPDAVTEDMKERAIRAAEYLQRDVDLYETIKPGTQTKMGKFLGLIGLSGRGMTQVPTVQPRQFPQVLSPQLPGQGAGVITPDIANQYISKAKTLLPKGSSEEIKNLARELAREAGYRF